MLEELVIGLKLTSDCIDKGQFIRTEVFVVILNLSVGIVSRVIHVLVVKDDAVFVSMGVYVVKVDSEFTE